MISKRGLGRGHLLLLLLFGTIIANGQREEPNPILEKLGPLGWMLQPFSGNVANGGKPSPNPEPTTSADTGSRIGHSQHWLMSDGKVQLAPGWDGKIDSYTNCQKETKENDTYYSLADADMDKGCSVELFVDEKQDEIDLHAVVESGTTLLECLTEDAMDNALPFIYGKDNEYLKKIAEGPELENGACVEEECQTFNRKPASCMKSTSLEVMWEKIDTLSAGKILRSRMHPVGEVSKNYIYFDDVIETDQQKSAAVKVAIEKEADGTGIFKFNNVENSRIMTPACIAKDKAVPPPVFWHILDQQGNNIVGKKLLTINLLPPKASRRVFGPKADPNVSPNKPICKLSIKFASKMFQPLTAEGLGITIVSSTTTIETTSTTTMETTTTTSAASISPPTTSTMRTTQSGSKSSTGYFSSGTTTRKHGPGNGGQKPAESKEDDSDGDNLLWIILASVGGVFILTVIGFLIWHFACRHQGKMDTYSSGNKEETEDSAATAEEQELEQQQQQAETEDSAETPEEGEEEEEQEQQQPQRQEEEKQNVVGEQLV